MRDGIPESDSNALSMGVGLYNYASFQIGWFACVVGAAQGYPWVGPVVVFLLVCVHLALSLNYKAELSLIVVTGLMGWVTDSFLIMAGVLSFPLQGESLTFSPPWMVALWINFATTLRYSMRWILGRYWISALLGAVGGPFAYWAGERLGAVDIHDQLGLGILALVWLPAVPALVWLAGRGRESK